MLVITRRPGESIFIGESIELRIVDIDWRLANIRCALSAIDQHGEELALGCATRRDGVAVVRLPPTGHETSVS